MTITFTVLEIKKKQNLSFSNMAAGKYYKTVFFFFCFLFSCVNKINFVFVFLGGEKTITVPLMLITRCFLLDRRVVFSLVSSNWTFYHTHFLTGDMCL